MTNWYSDEMATFGDRLAGAREAAGLSQTELAQRLGVRERTVAAWEDDRAEPRANRLQMLAGMLNVTLMWLLTGKGEGAPAPEEESARQTGDVDVILTDLALMRAEMGRMAERVAAMERRLRRLSRQEAA